MTAQRQSSPFAGILEPAERWAVYSRFEPAGREVLNHLLGGTKLGDAGRRLAEERVAADFGCV
jgi:hypothetical protein